MQLTIRTIFVILVISRVITCKQNGMEDFSRNVNNIFGQNLIEVQYIASINYDCYHLIFLNGKYASPLKLLDVKRGITHGAVKLIYLSATDIKMKLKANK